MVAELTWHETELGAVTASLIVPAKWFCAVTVMVAVPEDPLLKLKDEGLVVRVMSRTLVTVTVSCLG